MASILPFDELNAFKIEIEQRFSDVQFQKQGENKVDFGFLPFQTKNREKEDTIDELFDLFLLAYARAVEVTNANLSSDYKPTLDEIMSVVDAKVAGKTWRERVEEYFDQTGEAGASGEQETEKNQPNLPDAIIRIAETETHRIANTSALETAKKAGARFKTWSTVLDDRVRESHEYLEGETVEIGEDFYTFDGDHASAPGLFELAENNVNCRCELLFS